ncbi:hypothetical protein [Xylophilus sp. GOD-11R]|uniref:hypothetical protein n=1 Tax=Xylophilus sp. GOD-11R TaxID=3089814 RepID=UPI00298CEA8D|nr:hypothetical protein [Xylophilus sp. GOD-11R]WPB56194.1 hypothetical protein R9X41_18910 [Xylophilus sp. GOD-11R]
MLQAPANSPKRPIATVAPWPKRSSIVELSQDIPTRTGHPSTDMLTGLPGREETSASDAWASTGSQAAMETATQTTDADELASTLHHALDGTTADGHALKTDERLDIVMAVLGRAWELLESVCGPANHAPLNAMLANCIDRLDALPPADASRVLVAILEGLRMRVPLGVRSVMAGQDRLAARLIAKLTQAVSQGSSEAVAAIAGNPSSIALALDLASRRRHAPTSRNRIEPRERDLFDALADAGGVHPSIDASARLSAMLPLAADLFGSAARVFASMVAPLIHVARYSPSRPQHMHHLHLLMGNLPSCDVRKLLYFITAYATKRPEDGSPDDGLAEIRRIRDLLAQGSIAVHPDDVYSIEHYLKKTEAQLRPDEVSPTVTGAALGGVAHVVPAAALEPPREAVMPDRLAAGRRRKQAHPQKLEIETPSP